MGLGRVALLLLCGVLFFRGASANPVVPNIYQQFETLIRLEVALLTEAEITHAAGYQMQVDFRKLKQGSWEANVYQQLLVDRSGMNLSPDSMVFSTINQLKAYTLVLLGTWARNPQNSEALVVALKKVNNANYNVMSAMRFYIRALGDRDDNLKIYRANMMRLMNQLQQAIFFLRQQQPIQYQALNQYHDNGIAPMQQPSERQPYPIYVPGQTENPETRKPELDYLEGEVISPNNDALKDQPAQTPPQAQTPSPQTQTVVPGQTLPPQTVVPGPVQNAGDALRRGPAPRR